MTISPHKRGALIEEYEGFLRVQVLSPEGTVWEGIAQSVSSVNAEGPFDLLPEHAHFISMVQHAPITVVTAKGEQETFIFDLAVVRVMDDLVSIFADIVPEEQKNRISAIRDGFK